MKKKTNKLFKIFLSLLAVILLFSLPILTRSSEPYVYPVPDNYDSLSLEEQKAVYSIPENVAKRLTTEALFVTILSNPFISEMYIPVGMDDTTYSKILKENEDRFRLIELLGRLDADKVMRTGYFNYYEDWKNSGSTNISDLDAKMNFVGNLSVFGRMAVYTYKPVKYYFSLYYNIYFGNQPDQW